MLRRRETTGKGAGVPLRLSLRAKSAASLWYLCQRGDSSDELRARRVASGVAWEIGLQRIEEARVVCRDLIRRPIPRVRHFVAQCGNQPLDLQRILRHFRAVA